MHTSNLLAACTAALLLAACGGGGSTSTAPTPAPTPVPLGTAVLQGLWQSTAAGTTTTAAIVLPDGRMWQASTDTSKSPTLTRLVKASISGQSGSYTGAAKRYVLDDTGAAPTAVTVSATVVEKASLNNTVAATGASDAYSLAYLARYDTPAALADFTGSWTAKLGAGVVSWSITGAGVLSGSWTTGCTFAGQLNLRAEAKAVVETAITETCGSTVRVLQGVGALAADKNHFTVFMTSSDETSASVVSLGR
jgi:hypothetical protein